MRGDLKTICALAAALSWLPVSNAARADILAGVLRCRVEAGLSFVVGSRRDVKCLYKPNGSGPREYLVGTTDRYGLALGYRFSGTLVWNVRSSLHDINGMQGTYAGVGGEAKIFEGPNADVLIGGYRGLVQLRPSTVGGPTGFEVSAGIGRLELTRVPRSALFDGLDDDDIE